jgi:hypothetical protein
MTVATKTPKKPRPKQLGFDFDVLTAEAQSYVAATAAIRHRRKKGVWRGMPAVPPGSLLETVLFEFQSKTNIPLEIPFATFIHYIAAVLIGKGIQVDYQGKKMGLDVWTIVLAASCSGKTWTEKEIGEGLGGQNVPMLSSSAASAARWLEELEANPRSLWIRDEYFQLLKQIDNPASPMHEMKDYLLRAYDNTDIERSTKRDRISVKNPVLSVLGFSSLLPFVDGMDIENLVDGFAQRFAYVLARPDKNRPFQDYPFWSVDKTDWKSRFNGIFQNLCPSYKADASAEKMFARMFKQQIGSVSLEESFYRRIMHRAHKYALIYHIVRGAGKDEVLTEEDYGWAARLIEMQLNDAAELIDMCSGTDISKAIEAAEGVIKKLESANKPVTARAIVMGTRLITNVALARLVMQILGVSEMTSKTK